MANTTITISELPPIGNAFTASTILPVVQTTGVVSTDSASLGNLGNYILTQAGANLQPAYVANFAYAVTNAAQPLITSVGNLTNLTMAGTANLGSVSNVTITGGYNGQFLQTNGNGNLNWALPASGNVTNYPAGANAQIQFNQSGNFGASTSLTWDDGNYSLRTTNMNATGNISAGYFIGDGGGLSNLVANTGNIQFSNTVISTADTLESITLQTYDNANSKTYSWLFDSQGDFTLPSNSTVYISGSSATFFSGNDTDFGISVNSYNWTFDAGTGTLFAPGDISLGNVTGTPTDGSILSASNIKIITDNYGNTWKFDIHGNLTLPGNTFAINYANGMQVPLSNGGTANKIYNGNSNVTIPNADGNVIINAEINEWIFDATTGELHIPSGATLTYNGLYDFQINVGNGAPNVYSWNFDAGGNLVLPGNTFSVNYANGQQVSLGSGTYGNSNVAAFLENYGSNTITTTGNVTTGLLTVPASDNGSIVFSDNGTDINGVIKVDGGLNMTLSANSNFYVKQGGNDKFAITDGNTDLMASTNVVIHSNKAGTENKWIFDSSGNLSLPGSANYQVPGLGGNGHFDINSWYPVNISTGDGVNDAVSTWNFGYNGTLSFPNNFATIFADTGANQLNIGAGGDGGGYVTINATTDTGIGGSQNVFIQSNFSGNGYIWNFDNTGNLTTPGSIVTGNGSGGNISGVDIITANYYLGDGSNLSNITGSNIIGADGNASNVLYGNGVFAAISSGTSNTIQDGPSLAYIDGVGGNFVISISDSDSVWSFGVGGDITFPGGSVQHGAYGGPDFPSVSSNSGKYLYTDGTQLLWQTVSGGSYGNSNVVTLLANYGSNTITTTGNVTTGNANIGGNLILASSSVITSVSGSNANINIDPDGTGVVNVTGNIFITGANTQITNNTANGILKIGSFTGATPQVIIQSGPATYFYNNIGGVVGQSLTLSSGGLTVSNNITVGGNYVVANNKAIVSTAGSNANITLDPDGTGNVNIVANANVSGNINANYFIGNGSQLTGVNVSLIGNVTGTTPNVTLVAGSYNYVFDNTGNFTLPTNGDLIFSANTTLGSVAGSNGNITINPDGTGQLIVTSTTPAVFGNTLNVSGNITASGSAGVITPNRPAFRVYGSSSTIWSTTTNTNGILNANNWTVDYNQGGYLNSSTGVFTAPVAGLYQLNLVCRVANNTSPSAQAIVIKNYGSGNVNQIMWESGANPTINHFGVSTVSKLAAGDTLTLKVTVGSLIFDSNDNWSVAYLG